MTYRDQGFRHRTQCTEQLCQLNLLIRAEEVPAAAPDLAAEVRDRTNAVIAEVEASSRAVIGSGPRDPGAETFLYVRVIRLALTADEAVDAARRGETALLRAALRNFDAMVSAVWTVQHAVYAQTREPDAVLSG
jgi:hypothetical protein